MQEKNSLSWIQLAIQTVVLLTGFLVWSMAQEHRLTVIEESLKVNREIMETLTENQKRVIDTLNTLAVQQKQLETLLDTHMKATK